MKKTFLALASLFLLALTACGGSSESSAPASSSSEATSATTSATTEASPSASPTSSANTASNIVALPEGTEFTFRITANGAYRVVYDGADDSTVSEKIEDGAPLEVTIPGSSTLWSVQADNPATEGATEIRCEILVDGEVVAWQTQAENENQNYPTTYCAVSTKAG